MSSRHGRGWDSIYHHYGVESLPWELGRPRDILVEIVKSGKVRPCKTLDVCCGAGTNPVYLAEKGFEVTALDVSDAAVEYAKKKAERASLGIDFLVGDFLHLPFGSRRFSFVFDFGCFHHVPVKDRSVFIEGIHRVLTQNGMCLLVCFSQKNGPSWNHFTKELIIQLFGDRFEIKWLRHTSSLEADSVRRYFYEVLMKRLEVSRKAAGDCNAGL